VCKIETIEFIKLLLIWAEETFKYKNRCGELAEVNLLEAENWIKDQWKFINNYELEYNK
jgi:hypothetical protein